MENKFDIQVMLRGPNGVCGPKVYAHRRWYAVPRNGDNITLWCVEKKEARIAEVHRVVWGLTEVPDRRPHEPTGVDLYVHWVEE